MIPKRHVKMIHDCALWSHKAYLNDVSGTFIYEESTDAQAFVFQSGSDIIVTGQGSTSMRDWSLDFQIWRTRVDYLQNTKVHAGFMKQYNSIRDRMHHEIAKLMSSAAKENMRIICTGHSLFGAIATVAALDCSFKYDVPVHCITFGSPRVGSKKFAKLFNSNVEVSYRCVRFKDPVSFTPAPIRFKHVRGGLHFGKCTDPKSIGSDTLSLYNCCGCRVSHHSMEDYAAFTLQMVTENYINQV